MAPQPVPVLPGHLVFDYGGRRYVGPEIPGGRGVELYHRILPLLLESGAFEAGAVSEAKKRRARVIAATLRLAANPAVLPLVRETLLGFTVDGISIDGSWDLAFAGRPADAMGAAMEVWERSGFFAVPGLISTAVEAPAAPVEHRDAV